MRQGWTVHNSNGPELDVSPSIWIKCAFLWDWTKQRGGITSRHEAGTSQQPSVTLYVDVTSASVRLILNDPLTFQNSTHSRSSKVLVPPQIVIHIPAGPSCSVADARK